MSHIKYWLTFFWFTFIIMFSFSYLEDKIDRDYKNLRSFAELDFQHLKFKIDCLDKNANHKELFYKYVEENNVLSHKEKQKLIEGFENELKNLGN